MTVPGTNVRVASRWIYVLIAVWLAAQALPAQPSLAQEKAGDAKDVGPEARQKPPDALPVAADDLEAAVGRGVQFLVEHQNRDGSWGSPSL